MTTLFLAYEKAAIGKEGNISMQTAKGGTFAGRMYIPIADDRIIAEDIGNYFNIDFAGMDIYVNGVSINTGISLPLSATVQKLADEGAVLSDMTINSMKLMGTPIMSVPPKEMSVPPKDMMFEDKKIAVKKIVKIIIIIPIIIIGIIMIFHVGGKK